MGIVEAWAQMAPVTPKDENVKRIIASLPEETRLVLEVGLDRMYVQDSLESPMVLYYRLQVPGWWIDVYNGKGWRYSLTQPGKPRVWFDENGNPV
jgi:hypothetical protein